MAKRIIIFDTTLRDGEQSPGVALNAQEKLEIARQLARLGVDVIEAGFPITSPGDFEAVKLVSQKVKGATIAALARTSAEDIDAAWEAIRCAESARIHTFIASSPIHMKHKLGMEPDQVLERAVWAVKRAKGYVSDVEFSCEDASRSEPAFMYKLLTAVIDAGATTVNVPDTVGYATPEEHGEMISGIIKNVPNIDRAIISVHCHNDLGLAVANSLAAIAHGAGQVEGAINGIGERAGNASLEEIIMALYTRPHFYEATTRINYSEIYRTSRLVSALTGMPVQPNKAIVGKNAFSHESGIHQDGVLKNRSTYEIMNPRLIGIYKDNIVLGKLSGRHAFKDRLAQLGYELSEEEIERAFKHFKVLADRKGEITTEDLEALITQEIKVIPEKYQLGYLHFFSGTNVVPTATVGLTVDEETIEEAAVGDGPVDAAFHAIDKMINMGMKLNEYSITATTAGKNALGEVSIKVESGGRSFIGRGVSTDVVEASVKAYIDAANKVSYERSRHKPEDK